MKMSQLKTRTRDIWLLLHECEDAVPQPENFKSEVRTFGDLRCKDTWRSALANFWALCIAHSVLDPVALVTFYLNPVPEDWTWEVRCETFEAFVRIPGGLDAVREGLTCVLGRPTPTHGENVNGIFELVAATAGVRRLPADR